MTRRGLGSPLREERGIALILTVLVLSLLIVIVFEVNSLTRMDLLGAAQLRDETQAEMLCRSGVQEAIRLLRADDPRVDDTGEDWAQVHTLPVDIAAGKLSFTISDESGKFNVNRLLKYGVAAGPGGQQQATQVMDEGEIQGFLRLLDALGIDRSVGDPLFDWLDADDVPRASGAESDYYMTLDPPYRAKNGPLDTLGELSRIKGYKGAVLNALMGREKDPGSRSPLSPLLTLYSTGRINVNTAPVPVLRSLDDQITDDVADEIVKAREEEPFSSIPDIKRAAGVTEEVFRRIAGHIDIKSSTFSVRSTGEVEGVSRTVWAILRRQQDGVHIISWQED